MCFFSISHSTNSIHLSQTAFSVTGDWAFGHAFLSPSLPYSSSLSSTSLSMKSFQMVLTRSYRHILSVMALKSTINHATPSWHLLHLSATSVSRWFSERRNHSDFVTTECLVLGTCGKGYPDFLHEGLVQWLPNINTGLRGTSTYRYHKTKKWLVNRLGEPSLCKLNQSSTGDWIRLQSSCQRY